MRIDQATISFAPRTTSNCLDLATLYYGRHLLGMLRLTLYVAVPSCAAVYYLGRVYETDMRTTALVWFFASALLGILVALAVVPNAFGEPFCGAAFRQRLRKRGGVLIMKAVFFRVAAAVASMLFIIPGLWLTVRYGFFAERDCLTRPDPIGNAHNGSEVQRKQLNEDPILHGRRADQLLKEQTGDLLVRSLGITGFCSLLVVVIFFSVDYTLQLLFGFPILVGRVGQSLPPSDRYDGDFEYAMAVIGDAIELSWSDPLVMTILTATVLVIYPIGRLAWFFCYVDVRVRRDLWDRELSLLQARRRIGEKA